MYASTMLGHSKYHSHYGFSATYMHNQTYFRGIKHTTIDKGVPNVFQADGNDMSIQEFGYWIGMEGPYVIKSKLNGMVLDVEGANRAAGTHTVVWPLSTLKFSLLVLPYQSGIRYYSGIYVNPLGLPFLQFNS